MPGIASLVIVAADPRTNSRDIGIEDICLDPDRFEIRQFDQGVSGIDELAFGDLSRTHDSPENSR